MTLGKEFKDSSPLKDIFVVIMRGGLLVLFSSLESGMSNILQCRGQSHTGLVPLLRHNGNVPSNFMSNRSFLIHLIYTNSDIKAKQKINK